MFGIAEDSFSRLFEFHVQLFTEFDLSWTLLRFNLDIVIILSFDLKLFKARQH